MLKCVMVTCAVVVIPVGAAMTQESDGPGTYALQSLVREADRGSVDDYGYRSRTFLVYSSDCDDYIAEECGVVSFACTVHTAPQRPKVSFFGVESYQLVAMLRMAASLLPDSYEEMVDSRQIALPKEAFRLLTERGELEVQLCRRTDHDA